MAIKQTQRGFALLIAIIFMSVMLAFGLALGSIAYKQQVLAASSVQSQYAFYAADAALECALYADQKLGLFMYPSSNPSSAPPITCDGTPSLSETHTWSPEDWSVTYRVSLDSDKRCADVTIFKPNGLGTNYIFSQGYDVACSVIESPGSARFVARGINIWY